MPEFAPSVDYSTSVDAALDTLVGLGFLSDGDSDETRLLITALIDQLGFDVGVQDAVELQLYAASRKVSETQRK